MKGIFKIEVLIFFMIILSVLFDHNCTNINIIDTKFSKPWKEIEYIYFVRHGQTAQVTRKKTFQSLERSENVLKTYYFK